jgi:tight adherence protein B
MSGSEAVLILGAAAGGLAAAAAGDAVRATPAAARWMARAVEPLRRAGDEGYAPTPRERRRLALLGAGVLLGAGWLVVGPGGAPLLALAGPGAAGVTLRRRRARYLRSVEEGLGGLAVSIADALSGGRSLRAAIADAAGSEGPAAVELARVRADLELGRPTAAALAGLAKRIPSPRVAAFCAALISQRAAGGDLAGLMRRFAVAASERDRAAAEARSATAQARFTGVLVAAMPVGAALFAELIEPGFVAAMLGQPASAVVLALAALLQLAGFLAIARLSRVDTA